MAEPTVGRRLVAIHEAGHVVVGQHHGMPMEYVTLTSDPGRLGHVKPMQSSNPGGYQCHDIMPTFLAGAVAQDIAAGCRDRQITVRAAAHDFPEVLLCARLVRQAQRAGDDPGMDIPANATVRKIAEVAWLDAWRLVAAGYGAIQALADALLGTGGALTQDDCRRIIAAAGNVEPPTTAALAKRFWPPIFMPRWWTPEPSAQADRRSKRNGDVDA